MKKRLIALIGLVFGLSACAPVATYKPYGVGSALTGAQAMGYKETKLEEGKWFVQYIASTAQDEGTMIQFAMRRANEVGEEQCDGAYTKSEPTLSSDVTGYVDGIVLTRKTVNITVTCHR